MCIYLYSFTNFFFDGRLILLYGCEKIRKGELIVFDIGLELGNKKCRKIFSTCSKTLYDKYKLPNAKVTFEFNRLLNINSADNYINNCIWIILTITWTETQFSVGENKHNGAHFRSNRNGSKLSNMTSLKSQTMFEQYWGQKISFRWENTNVMKAMSIGLNIYWLYILIIYQIYHLINWSISIAKFTISRLSHKNTQFLFTWIKKL